MDNIQKFTNDNKFVRKKKTIMICEDEPDVLLSFELLLKSKYNLILVGSGEECIKKYINELNRGKKIHLVYAEIGFITKNSFNEIVVTPDGENYLKFDLHQ